jgi:phospholipase C
MGAAGAAGIVAPLLPKALKADTPDAGSISVIKNVVFLMQENHSYDTYYGMYSGNPAGVGIPSGFTNGGHKPYHFSSLSANTDDPNHDWSAIHQECAEGAMTGFYAANGMNALGYYKSTDLPYYYSLLPKFTICGNYFCSMLTETQPNRQCSFAGTSGGNTTDDVPNGYYNSSTFPIIFDLLKEYGVTFKNYNFGVTTNYSYAALWTNWEKGGPGNELNATEADFTSDCKNGTLPQVTYITNNYQEHPGSVSDDGTITEGANQMKSIIAKIMASPNWANTAIFLTYDEGGGFFDHVTPPTIAGENAYGGFGSMGIRVPCLVISPYAKVGYVDQTQSEHSSILKFMESLFGLPTLASVNSLFNTGTPASSYNESDGGPFPPRDGQPLSVVSDMTNCFNFSAEPNLYPDVPGAPWYSGR